jgi:hypothetical protein
MAGKWLEKSRVESQVDRSDSSVDYHNCRGSRVEASRYRVESRCGRETSRGRESRGVERNNVGCSEEIRECNYSRKHFMVKSRDSKITIARTVDKITIL